MLPFYLVLEVVVGDVDGWFSRFLEDEKIPPRKGLKANIERMVYGPVKGRTD